MHLYLICTILYNLAYCGVDEDLASTFRTLSDATCIVYEQFATIAQWQKDLNVYHSRMFFFVFVLCLLLAKNVSILSYIDGKISKAKPMYYVFTYLL